MASPAAFAEATTVACCAPIASTAITAGDADNLATLFKALADPNRVRIVNLLANSDGPVCVCDVTADIGLSQPTTSFHLKKLLGAGLIDREQKGTWAYYSLNRDSLRRLAQVVEPRKGKR